MHNHNSDEVSNLTFNLLCVPGSRLQAIILWTLAKQSLDFTTNNNLNLNLGKKSAWPMFYLVDFNGDYWDIKLETFSYIVFKYIVFS